MPIGKADLEYGFDPNDMRHRMSDNQGCTQVLGWHRTGLVGKAEMDYGMGMSGHTTDWDWDQQHGPQAGQVAMEGGDGAPAVFLPPPPPAWLENKKRTSTAPAGTLKLKGKSKQAAEEQEVLAGLLESSSWHVVQCVQEECRVVTGRSMRASQADPLDVPRSVTDVLVLVDPLADVEAARSYVEALLDLHVSRRLGCMCMLETSKGGGKDPVLISMATKTLLRAGAGRVFMEGALTKHITGAQVGSYGMLEGHAAAVTGPGGTVFIS